MRAKKTALLWHLAKKKKKTDLKEKRNQFTGLLIQKVWNYKDIKFAEVTSLPIVTDYEMCNEGFSYLLYISKPEAITPKKIEIIYLK